MTTATLKSRPATRKPARKANGGAKQARLYYFDTSTVERIEHLGQVFGGKEKGISAAIGIVSNLLRGEAADLRIASRKR